MIDLKQQRVVHKMFGEGIVIYCDDQMHITVNFSGVLKEFSYPIAFQDHLRLMDSQLVVKVEEEISEFRKAKDRAKEEKNSIFLNIHRPAAKIPVDNRKSATAKAYKRRSIAFKCNYCDGGKNEDRIGYFGVCSDEMINYNIGVAKHTWCSSDACECLKRYQQKISRAQLENNEFVCYESNMLRQWRALAGVVQNGENKGTPMKLNSVQSNSLCVLTTRLPYTPESERLIFGVFIVDDSYEGDLREEGYVTTTSKYKVALSMSQTKQVRFWNVHANDNNPDVPVWSSGLHRYLNYAEAVQILKIIVEVKQNTPDEALATETLLHFCSINGIDPESIGSPNGALRRQKIMR